MYGFEVALHFSTLSAWTLKECGNYMYYEELSILVIPITMHWRSSILWHHCNIGIYYYSQEYDNQNHNQYEEVPRQIMQVY